MLLVSVFSLNYTIFLDVLEPRDVVKIRTPKQVPVVLIKGQISFHPLDRDDKPLNDLLAHGLVHRAQVILHLVQCLNVRQVAFVLCFLGYVNESLLSFSLVAFENALREFACHT